MKSRNIFVTGGMGGIGKACVQKFINQGDKVVFTYAQEKSNEIEAEKFATKYDLFDVSSILIFFF